MTRRVLSDVTGAQTSEGININRPAADALLVGPKPRRVEIHLSGTFTDIAMRLDLSFDGSTWQPLGGGGAPGEPLLTVSEVTATHIRVVTTGTAGPYSADLGVSEAG